MASRLGTWVLGTTEHRRTPGHPRAHRIVGPLVGLQVGETEIPGDADIEADLAIEVLVDGRLTATGTIRAPWRGECRRCLEEVHGTAEVAVQEVFEHAPGLDADTYALGVDRVDLEPMVRDALLLALPIAPVCRDDCAGPDPDDHPVGVGEAEPEADPRWAALGELKFE